MGARAACPSHRLHETAGADEVLRQQLPARLNARRIFGAILLRQFNIVRRPIDHFSAGVRRHSILI